MFSPGGAFVARIYDKRAELATRPAETQPVFAFDETHAFYFNDTRLYRAPLSDAR